jgi:hypothetical protein
MMEAAATRWAFQALQHDRHAAPLSWRGLSAGVVDADVMAECWTHRLALAPFNGARLTKSRNARRYDTSCLNTAEGKTTEWILRAYQRRTLAADALIASTHLAGTNTQRSSRRLPSLVAIVAQIVPMLKPGPTWCAAVLRAPPLSTLSIRRSAPRLFAANRSCRAPIKLAPDP